MEENDFMEAVKDHALLNKMLQRAPTAGHVSLEAVISKPKLNYKNEEIVLQIVGSLGKVKLHNKPKPKILDEFTAMNYYGTYRDEMYKVSQHLEESGSLDTKSIIRQKDRSSEEIKATLESLVKELKSPYGSVNNISFIGPIPIQVTTGIIDLCKCLQKLYIHFTSLNGVKLEDISTFRMDLPLLETFGVGSSGIDEGPFSIQLQYYDLTTFELLLDMCIHLNVDDENKISPLRFLDFCSMFNVLSTILNQNQFPMLKLLNLSIPYCNERENSLVTALGGFLSRHHESLEGFCYHQGFNALVIPPPEELESRKDENRKATDENGNELVDDDHVSMTRLAINAGRLKKLTQLKDVYINLTRQQESDPLWKNFILHQEKLERLIFTGESQIPFPGNTIRHNAKTLKILVLDVRDDVDLKYLKDCKTLKKLTIMADPSGKDLDDNDIQFDTDPNLLNVNKLPKSLEKLALKHLKIHRTDVDFIVSTAMTHLREFELTGGGTKGELGVSCKTVASVWQEKRLDRFTFKYCMNENSLKEKAMPEAMGFLAAILKENCSLLDFKVSMRLHEGRYVWDDIEECAFAEFLSKPVLEFHEDVRPGYDLGHGGYKDEDLEDNDDDEEDSSDYSTAEESADEESTTENEDETAVSDEESNDEEDGKNVEPGTP